MWASLLPPATTGGRGKGKGVGKFRRQSAEEGAGSGLPERTGLGEARREVGETAGQPERGPLGTLWPRGCR